MTRLQRQTNRWALTGIAFAALAACDNLDADLRGFGNGFTTADAVQNLPNPDARGVISYPTYQVVVAERDDTIRKIAGRLGQDTNTLAAFNGIDPDAVLRQGEIVALPTPVAPIGAAPAASALDITAVASTALDRADAANGPIAQSDLPPANPTAVAAPTAGGAEPIRHQVVRGETAFSIARLYDVPVTTIAQWNSLNSEFTIREGQFLLIPRNAGGTRPATSTGIAAPGAGSIAPAPPSAATPLPTQAAAAPAPVAPTPAPAAATATTSSARLAAPVQGSIIRGYAPGSNEGVDFGVPAGTDVRAADAGIVAAVTADTSGGSIVVIRHGDGLLTVYTQMDNVSVTKDANVSRGQTIGKVRAADPSFLHFEVRRGLQSLDPVDFLP
jgi:lipoprotein NlpD